MRIAALILAGGSIEAPDGTSCPTALLPIGNRRLYEIVLSAVTNAVELVMVAGDLPLNPYNCMSITPGKNPIEHAANALHWLEKNRPDISHIMVCPVDQPFIMTANLLDFLRVARKSKAGWVYSFASVRDCKREYPDMKRTGFLGWTGGNVMLFQVKKLAKVLDSAQKVFQARKNPLLAVWLSLVTIFTRGLSLKLVRCSPALASDIDRWQHYLDVCRVLNIEPLTTLVDIG